MLPRLPSKGDGDRCVSSENYDLNKGPINRVTVLIINIEPLDKTMPVTGSTNNAIMKKSAIGLLRNRSNFRDGNSFSQTLNPSKGGMGNKLNKNSSILI